jgi:exosortase C (VPDSG-CTERM-specific)
MNLSQEQHTIPAPSAVNSYKRVHFFALSVAVLAILFFKPLYDLLRYAIHSELYSHVPLIPCVSFYLLWKKREQLAARPFDRLSTEMSGRPETAPCFAFSAFAIGLAALAFYWFSFRKSGANQNDALSLMTFSFVAFVAGFYLLFLGKNLFNATGFPIAFLFFIIPFPTFFTTGIETFFQHASASAAEVMLQLSGATFFRNGLEFRLPKITLFVAPECSGIRSTLVLFITSLIAGHLFLRSFWKKTGLALFVIPLAIFRNGFRIFVIAQLCIQRGPEMIDSPIHHRGGPIFFVLSLIPFFVLLFFLHKPSATANVNRVK